MRTDLKKSKCCEAYQANTRSENVRESVKDVDGRIKPFCPSLISTPGLIQTLNLLLKDDQNGTGRLACLELSSEWMCT